MSWLPFRRPRTSDDTDRWWDAADAATAALSTEAIGRLCGGLAHGTLPQDEHERRTEMIDGLVRLHAMRDVPLETVRTQHRVIGTDVCHLVVPASLAAAAGTSGKLLLTSARAIFVGIGVQARPWHRVRAVARTGRDVALVIGGEDAPFAVRCNTYGDALAAWHIAGRLKA